MTTDNATNELQQWTLGHNLLDVADTPCDRLVLVILKSRYTPYVTPDSLGGDEPLSCVVTLFADTRWTARRLMRACHAQLQATHGNVLRGHCPLLRNALRTYYFADAFSANPLLAASEQSRLVDPSLQQSTMSTLDAAHSQPNGDKVLDARLISLLDSGYLVTYPVDSSVIDAAAALGAECRAAYHDVQTCASHLLDICRRCPSTASHDSRCVCQTCRARRLVCSCVDVARDCMAASKSTCWCLFNMVLRRTTRLLRLCVVAATFDETSEYFGERVCDPTASQLVRSFVDRAEKASPRFGVGMCERFERVRSDAAAVYKPRRARRRKHELLQSRDDIPRPVPFASVTYDQIRAALGVTTTTICAHLIATRAFDDGSVIRDAHAWAPEPVRHYVRVAISGFDQYVQRLYKTAAASENGLLLSEACERDIYDELAAEPNRAVAMSRVLAFQSFAPSLVSGSSGCYTLTQHDNVVVYVIAVLYLMRAAESAAKKLIRFAPIGCERKRPMVGGTPSPLMCLVEAAEAARLQEGVIG